MSEQEFWSKFFQSHCTYETIHRLKCSVLDFHRERHPIEPSTSKANQPQNDTFADCVQMDEKGNLHNVTFIIKILLRYARNFGKRTTTNEKAFGFDLY